MRAERVGETNKESLNKHASVLARHVRNTSHQNQHDYEVSEVIDRQTEAIQITTQQASHRQLQPCLPPDSYLRPSQHQHVFLAPNLSSPRQSLFRTFSPKDLHTLLPTYSGKHEVRTGFPETHPFRDPSLAGGFHSLVCLPRFLRHPGAEGPSDPPKLRVLIRSLHLFRRLTCLQAPWCQSHDPADRAAGASLHFHGFGPGMRRVRLDLTVGTLLLIVSFQLFPSLAAVPTFLICGQNVLEVFVKVKFLVSRLCIDCQSFVITVFGRPRALSKTVDVFPKSAAQTLLRLKTCVLCSLHVSPDLFHEKRCLIFLFFPTRKASSLSPSLSLSLSIPVFLLSLHLQLHFQAVCSGQLLFPTLGPHDFLFFERFIFCRDLFPLSFWFHVLQVSTELCLPLLPTGCCHLVVVVPCHSLLFHLYHFSLSWPFSESQFSS